MSSTSIEIYIDGKAKKISLYTPKSLPTDLKNIINKLNEIRDLVSNAKS